MDTVYQLILSIYLDFQKRYEPKFIKLSGIITPLIVQKPINQIFKFIKNKKTLGYLNRWYIKNTDDDRVFFNI